MFMLMLRLHNPDICHKFKVYPLSLNVCYQQKK